MVEFTGFGEALGDLFIEDIDDFTFELNDLSNPILFYGSPETEVYVRT